MKIIQTQDKHVQFTLYQSGCSLIKLNISNTPDALKCEISFPLSQEYPLPPLLSEVVPYSLSTQDLEKGKILIQNFNNKD